MWGGGAGRTAGCWTGSPAVARTLAAARRRLRPSEGEGGGGGMKIAVLFDTLHPDWEDADYKKEVEAKVEEAEYDVARALMSQEHDVLTVGVADQFAPVLERLAKFQPKLGFNGCDSIIGHATHAHYPTTGLETH